MNRFVRPLIRPLVPALVALAAAPAAAETPGEKVIRIMDEAMTRAKDQRFLWDVTTQEPGKAARTLNADISIKGKEWRRVDFLGPGDVKGMKVLILSLTQMYVYLPAYRKVRRVASHAREQGFMGTTYSHDDMSVVTYGPVFSGKLLGETPTHYKVLATRRPGQQYPYAKLELAIHKEYLQATELRYFNDKGAHVKTEVRSEYQCKGKICTPYTMKLTDHTRNGAWTQFTCKKWEVDTGLPDSYFSVRALQRER